MGSLADLRWLLRPRGRHKLVAVFQGFFDDSGTHDKATVCVAAGFLASTRNWERFESRWRKAVRHLSSGFHAVEHLDSRAMRSTVDELLQIIHTSDIKQIVAAVDVASFFERTADERRHLTGGMWNPAKKKGWISSGSPNRPFYLPFMRVTNLALGEMKVPGKQVHFVFDRQSVLHGYAVDIYNSRKRLWP